MVLRFDGGPTIGFGHAMRSLALGTALTRVGFGVTILANDLSENLTATARSRGFNIEVASPCSSDWFEVAVGAAAVVVDGYGLGAELETLADEVPVIVAIDDNRELPVERASIVVNQNAYADVRMYADVAATLLLGTEYVLLRDEIVALRHVPHRSGLFVSFGGADPLRLTLPTAVRCAQAGVETIVAFNDDHPHAPNIRGLVDRTGQLRRDRGDLTDAIGSAAVGVIGAGTTLYEVATTGIPTIAVAIAANQRRGSADADARGWVVLSEPDPDAIVSAALDLLADDARRATMSAAGRRAVDGGGSDRVAAAIAARVG